MDTKLEAKAFSRRLISALRHAGVRPSPTRVAEQFNLQYRGRPITAHAARNWLIGQSIPTQDKLRVLAAWLHISPEALRFGDHRPTPDRKTGEDAESIVDAELYQRYLALSGEHRRYVRAIVTAFSSVSASKSGL